MGETRGAQRRTSTLWMLFTLTLISLFFSWLSCFLLDCHVVRTRHAIYCFSLCHETKVWRTHDVAQCFSFIPVVNCSTPVKHFNPYQAFHCLWCIRRKKLLHLQFRVIKKKKKKLNFPKAGSCSPLEGDVDVGKRLNMSSVSEVRACVWSGRTQLFDKFGTSMCSRCRQWSLQ